jgi:hypothetical protein
MFNKGSRYETVPDAIHREAFGREVPYKRLRRLPSPPSAATRAVRRGDRLDRIAYELYRDPEQFWRLADANLATRPEELTEELARKLAVPLL